MAEGFINSVMYYFAYGAKLNQKEMRGHCPDCQPKFIATLPHYQLVFVGWSRQWRGGVASIQPRRGEKVLGVVYQVSEKDLARLDRDEGYPRSAQRLNVTVFTEDGEAIPAVTHIKTGQAEETKPSPEYLALIQQGCADWGII